MSGMTIDQPMQEPEARALRARVRRVSGRVAVIIVALIVLIPEALPEVDGPILTAGGVALAVFLALLHSTRLDPWMDQYAWAPGGVTVLLLSAGSGGADSPFAIGFAVLAVYAAAANGTRAFVAAMAAMSAGHLSPLVYDPEVATALLFSELGGYGLLVLLTRLLTIRGEELRRQLTAQNDSFLALFDGNPLPMILLDRDGCITRLNDVARSMIDPTVDAVGQRLGDLPGLPSGAIEDAVERAREGEVATFDVHVDGDGGPRDFETTIVPTPGGMEAADQMVVIGRDVTSERAWRSSILRRSEQRTAVASLGMHALDHDTRVDDLLARAVELVAESLPADDSSVMVPDSASTIAIRAYAGDETAEWQGRSLPMNGSLGGFVYTAGQPLISSDFREETRFDIPRWLLEGPTRSGLAVVIHTREGRWGVLAAACDTPRQWTHDDLTFVQSIANVIGAAVERERSARQLRESEERFRLLADNAQDVITRFDVHPEPHLTYISPSVEDVLGVPPAEWLAQPERWAASIDADALAVEHPRGLAPLDQVATERIPHRHADGRTVWLESRRTPVHDEQGRLIAVEAIARDVTAQRRSQRLLQDALEQEQRMAEELRRIDTMKDNFMAAVSHELRTPLASVLGFAMTIEESRHRMSDEQLGTLTQRLATNAVKLDGLLTDLLDLDRMRRSVLEPSLRTIDLADLINRILETRRDPARRLEVEVPSTEATVDPPMVERIVENLVGNALKHTSPACTIWVRLEDDGDDLLLTVEDDGPGVPEELRAAVFQPFEQGPHDHPHAPGTGIGLSLVAQFAELHGGDAWCTERPGGGASFKVRLPRRPTLRVEAPASEDTGALRGA